MKWIDPSGANRSFLYGDGFFETIRLVDGALPLLPFNIARAKETAEFLQCDWPNEWDQKFFQTLIEDQTKNGALRLTFYRESGGKYAPTSSTLDFTAQISSLNDGNNLFIHQKLSEKNLHMRLSELKPIQVKIYDEIPKPINDLSAYKFNSSIYYVKAGLALGESGYSDILLLNDQGRICEGLSSNLVMYVDGKWQTPAKSEGPVHGTYLDFLQSFLKIQESQIHIEAIEGADALYLVNALSGFRKINVD